MILVALLLMVPLCEAAEQEAGVSAEDFSYQGLALGDAEENVFKCFGEPLFDREISVYGIGVREHEYKEMVVGVAMASGRVVDIRLSGKNYALREGVKRGATSYWLQKVYGKTARTWLEGVPYLIYTRTDAKYERLLLALDSTDWHLTDVRLTALPLTEEEADIMLTDGTYEETELLGDDFILEGKEIDLSRLPESPEPKLTIGG